MIKLTALIVTLIVIISGIYVIVNKDEEKKVHHSEDWWIDRISKTTSEFTDLKDNKIFIKNWSPDIDCAISTVCLTPLIVSHENSSVPEYNPLLINDNNYQSKGINTILDLSQRDQKEILAENPMISSIKVAKEGWVSSETIILVNSYENALLGAPLASYLGIPMIYFPENSTDISSTKESIVELNCKYGLFIGDININLGIETFQIKTKDVNNLFLKILSIRGDSTDYIVICNPSDVTDYYWGEESHLPIPSQSVLSAEIAAYHKGLIFFSEGLEQINDQFGDGYTQLGVKLEDSNLKANITKQRVLEGVNLLQEYSMQANYLCLVDGPVTLPFYYEDLMAYTEERQYLPQDYYFAELDGEPGQELAVGRIISKTVFDASALVVRNLAFDEIKNYQYPKDDSSTIYDFVSESWKENSMIVIGTTKIGPSPGILTPTLANQTITMYDAGFTPTTQGYDTAQEEVIQEIIDEMNYNVYYGHGDYDCWYTAAGNPVEANTINNVGLKPGFGIAMACLTGMTDNAEHSLDEYISLAFLNSGFTGYIGATRVAYGLYDYEQDENNPNLRGTDALYLVDMFSKKVCEEDKDVGIALMEAKNALISKQGWSEKSTKVTVLEYVLYGDPASNLYIPQYDN